MLLKVMIEFITNETPESLIKAIDLIKERPQ